jgi:hypothetical protein
VHVSNFIEYVVIILLEAFQKVQTIEHLDLIFTAILLIVVGGYLNISEAIWENL